MEHIPISEIVERLSATTKLSAEQVGAVLQAQAELAYELAERGYPIAGVGVLVKTNRPAAKMEMRFGPKRGQEISIPAKTMLKFRVASVAKDAALGLAKPPSNVLEISMSNDGRPTED